MAKRKNNRVRCYEAWRKWAGLLQIVNDPGGYIYSAFMAGWEACLKDQARKPKREAVERGTEN